MCLLFSLRVALLSTVVFAAVESPPALRLTGEATHKPVLAQLFLRIRVRRRML